MVLVSIAFCMSFVFAPATNTNAARVFVAGVDTIGVARGRSQSQSQSSRTCEDCGRTYSNLSNLRQHMRLVHFPTHPACDICQRRFKTDLYLKRHMHNSHDVFATHAYGPRRPFCDVSLTKLSSHTSRLY